MMNQRPPGGLFQIYDEPESPSEKACSRYLMKRNRQNEGALSKYMMNKNRQTRGRV